jgi:hypothetical protein
MGGIFISYRREDAAGHAGRLFDRLSEHFGRDRVFMDVSDIEPGVDFVEAIETAVGACEVLVVIVGKDWLKAVDASGRRRLDDPQDFIRLEVAAALKRNIRVIPVLVRGAPVPPPEALPPELEKLARRNAVELSDNRWDSDVREFIKLLDNALTKERHPRRKAVWPMAGAAAAALITIAAAYFTWPLVSPREPFVPPNETKSPDSASSPQKVETSKSPEREPGQPPATKVPIQLPAGASVNVARLNFRILSADLDSHDAERLALTFLIRMTNNREYPANFWDNSFRLQVNDVPQAPVSGLNELVEGRSAKEGRVVFVIANKTTHAKLRIESEGESTEIPLQLGTHSSTAAATPSSPAPQPAAPSTAPAPGKKPETVPVKAVTSPVLVSPAHNATMDNACKAGTDKTIWNFSWNKVEGASRYHLYVIEPQTDDAVIDKSDLTQTSYQGGLGAGYVIDDSLKGWRWRVRAEVNGEWGQWSKTRSFNVEPLDTDCKVVAAAETSALPKPSQPAPPVIPAPPAEASRPTPAKAPEPSVTPAPPPVIPAPRAEASRPTPAKPPEPSVTPAPPQEIALAPKSALPSSPSMPKVGDTWTYRLTSGWRGEKQRTFVHKIVGVAPLKETMTMGDNESDTKEFDATIELVSRRLQTYTRQEFSPFILAFTTLESGKSWKSIGALSDDAVIYPWNVQGKVVGPEQVSVPAGRFNAIKVELYGNRTADVSRAQAGSVAVRSKHVVWYAPEVKRVVKHTRNTFAPNGNDLDKDTYELVEYKLN